MAPDVDPKLVTKLAKDIQSSVQTRGYADVKVLVLYWQEGDVGFKEEGLLVRRLFEEVFHFHVTEYPIPSSDSLISLTSAVTQALAKGHSLQNQGGPALLVVHYGGHGDCDDDRHAGQERRHNAGDPTLNWYEIQDVMKKSDTDILLLLDCCYAAQAARDRERAKGRFEILAAAPMGTQTPGPGERSFTHVLLQEIRAVLDEEGSVDIKNLHGRICSRKHNLWATPVHINLKNSKQSIDIAPLVHVAGHDQTTLEDESTQWFLQLLVNVKQELDSQLTEQIGQWIKSDIPDAVSKIKVVVATTEHVHRAVKDLHEGTKPFARQVDVVSKEDIAKEWDTAIVLLEQFYQGKSGENTHERPGRRLDAGEFVDQLDAKNRDVLDLLERGILTASGIDDEDILDETAQDETIRALGMETQLRLRKIIRSSSSPAADTQSCKNVAPNSGHGRDILQEIKRYGPYVDPRELPAIEARVGLLEKLLSAPKDESFRSLECVGWSHQPAEHSYTLDFKVPADVTSSDFISLQSIIQTSKSNRRPSLNERLRISLYLARAVYKWHLVGWLHQGISSLNVIFFRKTVHGPADYSRPFLHGFEFSRPDSDPSIGLAMDDIETNVYRHPERHGSARKGHRKKHDIYSLGVVMLEIGLWQKAIDINRVKGAPSAEAIRAMLLENCKLRLAHFAGESYKAVVEACLSSDLGVSLDDESGSRLQKAFHTKVVDELEKGVKL